MIYSWICEKDGCNTVTDCTRRVADIDIKPDEGCEKCGNMDLRRVILPKNNGTKGFVLEGTGWHDQEYTKTRSIK